MEDSTCAHLFHFTADKAGMSTDKASREKANKLIYEMSRKSKYFERAQQMDAKTEERVQDMRRRIQGLLDYELTRPRKIVEQRKLNIPISKKIFCVVDMDMFYAAVEMRDNPTLIGKPVAVGGMGMICTANYEARKFGVRSAMPGFIAVKLVPSLIFIKPNMEKYQKASNEIMDIFKELDPNLHSMSMDEATLDLTDYIDARFPDLREYDEKLDAAASVVEETLKKVRVTTRLTCSAGVAPSKMVAKIASDFNKPNGMKIVYPHDMIAFCHALPIRKIPGVGKVTERLLKDGLEINTVAELWKKMDLCTLLFSERTSTWLLHVCFGGVVDNNNTEDEHHERKSVSNERTFTITSDPAEIKGILKKLSMELVQICRKKNIQGRTVTLKLKHSNFESFTRCMSCTNMIPKGDSCTEIYELALSMLNKCLPCELRLMGVKLSNLCLESGGAPAISGGTKRQRTLDGFLVPSSEICPPRPVVDIATMDVIDLTDEPELHLVSCPICSKMFDEKVINEHLDICLTKRM